MEIDIYLSGLQCPEFTPNPSTPRTLLGNWERSSKFWILRITDTDHTCEFSECPLMSFLSLDPRAHWKSCPLTLLLCDWLSIPFPNCAHFIVVIWRLFHQRQTLIEGRVIPSSLSWSAFYHLPSKVNSPLSCSSFSESNLNSAVLLAVSSWLCPGFVHSSAKGPHCSSLRKPHYRS